MIKRLLGNIPIIDFTRTKEKEFIEQGLSKLSTESEIISIMKQFPNLLERPIVIRNNSFAVVARDEVSLNALIS
jgi:arsenate reductase